MEESTTPGLYALVALAFLALATVFLVVLLAHAARAGIRHIRTRPKEPT